MTATPDRPLPLEWGLEQMPSPEQAVTCRNCARPIVPSEQDGPRWLHPGTARWRCTAPHFSAAVGAEPRKHDARRTRR